jgi:hypothetical protein
MEDEERNDLLLDPQQLSEGSGKKFCEICYEEHDENNFI